VADVDEAKSLVVDPRDELELLGDSLRITGRVEEASRQPVLNGTTRYLSYNELLAQQLEIKMEVEVRREQTISRHTAVIHEVPRHLGQLCDHLHELLAFNILKKSEFSIINLEHLLVVMREEQMLLMVGEPHVGEGAHFLHFCLANYSDELALVESLLQAFAV